MGAATFLEDGVQPARKPAGRQSRAIDLPLVAAIIAILTFGLIMMYSASWDYSLIEYGAPMHMFERQLMWLVAGLATAFVLSLFDYHHWRKLIVPAMGITVALLLAVLFMNELRLG